MRFFRHTWVFIFAFVIVALGVPSSAQTSTGQINGTLTDPSGAPVTEGKVTLHGETTGVDQVIGTNKDGIFIFLNTAPGAYTISAEAPGFKTLIRSGVTIQVNQTAVLDLQLSVGDITEKVTVTAEATQLQPASSELGAVVDERMVNTLPLNGRNFTQILTLTPGVTPVQNEQGAGGGTCSLCDVTIPGSPVFRPNVNGQYNRSNLYYLDGVFNTVNLYSGYAVLPIIDAVQEFKVQSHNDDPQYGGATGGVINLVSKSGTNQLHGSLWEYLRNNFFDARDPFADAQTTGPAPYHQNEFGATFGGPLTIPHVYSGKDRTFFFFAYEGWRYSKPTQVLSYVPTQAELSGDFSHSIIGQNIFDPTSTQAAPTPSGFTRTQYPNNIIPSSELSPLSVAYFNAYVDKPNYANPNLPQYNEIANRAQVDSDNTFQIKVDEVFGSKDTLSGRFTSFYNHDTTPSTELLSAITDRSRLNTGGTWIHQFTPSAVLSTTVGYLYTPLSVVNAYSNGPLPASQAGFAGTATYGVPEYILQGPWNFASGEQDSVETDHNIQFASNISIVKGRHHLTAGYQYLWQRRETPRGAVVQYSFQNQTTADPNNLGTTGASLASSLLGIPIQQTYENPSWRYDYLTWAAYVQDSWKVSPRLTLNFGLRYDQLRPPTSTPGTLIAGFDMSTGQFLFSGGKLPPPCVVNANNGICIPGDGTLASIPYGEHIGLSPCIGFKCTQNDNVGPRFGFGFQLDPKTVIRGGYNLLYDEYQGFLQNYTNLLGSWPSATTVFNYPNASVGAPLQYIQELQTLNGTPLPPATPWGDSFWNSDPNEKTPLSNQWNLEIQREVSKNLVASVAYVGSVNRRFDLTGIANVATKPGPGTPDEVNALRPYPYETALEYGASKGTSNYNSLQASLNQRMSNGFQYLLSYTWSKSLDNGNSGAIGSENGPGGGGAGIQNPYDPQSNYGVSAFNIPHYFSASGLYELPFGKGQQFLSSGPASWVLGNWQVTSIFSLRSGQPFTALVNGDVANIGTTYGYARANRVGDPHLSHGTSSEWFNTAAFEVPSFSYGDVSRNTLMSPHATQFDASAMKTFDFGEKANLQFRMDAFNVFNIINYSVPGNVANAPGFGVISSISGLPRQLQFSLKFAF